jgi:hypothetical protein
VFSAAELALIKRLRGLVEGQSTGGEPPVLPASEPPVAPHQPQQAAVLLGGSSSCGGGASSQGELALALLLRAAFRKATWLQPARDLLPLALPGTDQAQGPDPGGLQCLAVAATSHAPAPWPTAIAAATTVGNNAAGRTSGNQVANGQAYAQVGLSVSAQTAALLFWKLRASSCILEHSGAQSCVVLVRERCWGLIFAVPS